MCRKKSKNGSALAMVLVFMVVMSILGAGLLAVAQYSIVHSRTVADANKSFYAAESAAQLAAQMFLAEELALIYEDTVTADFGVSVAAAMEEMKNALYLSVLARLAEIENSINTNLAGMLFNGEEASVTINAPDLDVKIKGDYETFFTEIGEIASESGESFTEYIVTYHLKAYADEPTFQISATAGGRTVTAQPGYTVALGEIDTIVKPPVAGDIVLPDGFAVYKDYTGGVYGNAPGGANDEIFNSYISALQQLLSDAAAINVLDGAGTSNDHNGGGVLPGDASGYVFSGAGLTLGTAGTVTEYRDLEYLKVGGNMTISGTVICPNLKGVEVGGNITFQSGTSFNPISHFPNTPPSGGCNFKTNSTVYVRGDAEVNWSRFYAYDVVFNDVGGQRTIVSNSIFVASHTIHINSGITIDSTGPVPQFYAGVNCDFVITNKNFAGIFMAAGDEHVFNNGNITTLDSLVGFIMGNMITHWPIEPLDVVVEPFGEENKSFMMDGGLITRYLTDSAGTGGENSAPGLVTVEREVTISRTGLNLRETTGE